MSPHFSNKKEASRASRWKKCKANQNTHTKSHAKYGQGSLWVIKIIHRCYLPSKRSQSIISAYVVINYLFSVHTREDALWPGNLKEMSTNVLLPKGCGVKRIFFLIVSTSYSTYIPKRRAHCSVCYCTRTKSNSTSYFSFPNGKTRCCWWKSY